MTITQKQCLLTYLGYDTGGVDGIWGDKSRQATANFQRDFGGISVDGICGEQTEKALKHAVAYGIEKKPDSTDCTADCTGVQNNNTENSTNGNTGTFWDEIKYFTRAEFRCPCGRCGGFPVEPSEELVRLADHVREYFGVPVTVSSGVRCQAHNDELPGSAPNSYHVKGKAVDFCVRGKISAQVLAYVKTLPVHYAYAIDGSYVHMDVN